MTEHFLSKPGMWSGSGLITLPKIDQQLPFEVKWVITEVDADRTRAVQQVVIESKDAMVNSYIVTKKPNGEFELFLETEELGIFAGHGIVDAEQIAWEFQHYGVLEGMEVYRKEGDEKYRFSAEYSGGEGYTTKIEGSLTQDHLSSSHAK